MWLRIESPGAAPQTIELTGGVVLGRDESCDVVLSDDRVSRRHASLAMADGGTLRLEDLRSTNGTFVDGRRIEGSVDLRGGEEIHIGDSTLRLSATDPSVPAAPPVAAPPTPAPIAPSGPEPPRQDSRIGSVMARYRVERKISEGNMGVVYLAEHLRLGRKVALKVLARKLFRDERSRQRFAEESRAAASIDHPNIIPVYDADDVDGDLYIAMRYVDGADLNTTLERRGAIQPADALSIIRQVGSALDAAHARGLIHRDVKPGNILIASSEDPAGEGHVFLCDFGITKHLSGSGLTRPGQAIGTPNYMAPEQFLGEPVDSRTDIYALGCVLYECLTGAVPYERESEEGVMFGHIQAPVPSVSAKRPDLPAGLDTVIVTAMAKSKEERYPSCAAMVTALAAALAPVPPPAAGPVPGSGTEVAEAADATMAGTSVPGAGTEVSTPSAGSAGGTEVSLPAAEATILGTTPGGVSTGGRPEGVAEAAADRTATGDMGRPTPPPTPTVIEHAPPMTPTPTVIESTPAVPGRTVAEGMAVPPAPGAPAPPSPGMRKPLLIGAASFGAVLLIGLLIFFLVSGGGSGGLGSGGSGGSGGSEGTNGSVLAPKPQVGEVGPFSVALAWTEPSGGKPVDHYAIYRNGEVVTQVKTTSYTDEDLVPGRSYKYEVRAVAASGSDSASAFTTVKTLVPSLSTARFVGTFKVFYKVLSTTTTVYSTGDTFGDHWQVQPTCSTGACNATWRNTRFTELHTTLVKNGSTYRGQAKGYFGLGCGQSGKHEIAQVTITVHVTEARGGPGTWNATRLAGSVVEFEGPQFGCNGGRTTYSITVTKGI